MEFVGRQQRGGHWRSVVEDAEETKREGKDG